MVVRDTGVADIAGGVWWRERRLVDELDELYGIVGIRGVWTYLTIEMYADEFS